MAVSWDEFEAVDEKPKTDWAEFEAVDAPAKAGAPRSYPVMPVPEGGLNVPLPKSFQLGPPVDDPSVEVIKGATRGANIGVGGILKGIGALMTPTQINTLPTDDFGNPISPTTPEEQTALEEKLSVQKYKDIQENPLFQAGKYIARTGQDIKAPQGLPGQASEMVGSMVPVVLTGPAAPAMIGLQSYGDTLTSEYDKALQKGMREEDAAAIALNSAGASGLTQAAIWTVLPKPLQAVLSKVTGLAGEGAIKKFLANRVSGAVEGATLGATTHGAQNAVTGEPVSEGMGGAVTGMAALSAVMPRGATAKPIPAEVLAGELVLPRAGAAARAAIEKAAREGGTPQKRTVETFVPGNANEMPVPNVPDQPNMGTLVKPYTKPTVPETPAEPRTTVTEEIRNANADTIAKIQALFPKANLSREQARTYRDIAFPKQAATLEAPRLPIPAPAPISIEEAIKNNASAPEGKAQPTEVAAAFPMPIEIETPQGKRRVVVRDRLDEATGKYMLGRISVHNDATGSYEIFHPPAGKQFQTPEEAVTAGYALAREALSRKGIPRAETFSNESKANAPEVPTQPGIQNSDANSMAGGQGRLQGDQRGATAASASNKPEWLVNNLDVLTKPLEANGTADKIEELSAQRKTAREIAGALGVEVAAVRAVRANRNIPSMDDKAEFDTWMKNRNGKQPAAARENVSVTPEKLGLAELTGNDRHIEAAVLSAANEPAPAGLNLDFIKKNIARLPQATQELTGARAGGTGVAVRALVNELRRADDPGAVLDKWFEERNAANAEMKAASAKGDVDAIQHAGLRQQFANEGLDLIGNHGERLGLSQEVQAKARELRDRPVTGKTAGPEPEWLGKPLSHWEKLDVSKLTPVERQRIAKSLGVADAPKPIREALQKRVAEIRANPPKPAEVEPLVPAAPEEAETPPLKPATGLTPEQVEADRKAYYEKHAYDAELARAAHEAFYATPLEERQRKPNYTLKNVDHYLSSGYGGSRDVHLEDFVTKFRFDPQGNQMLKDYDTTALSGIRERLELRVKAVKAAKRLGLKFNDPINIHDAEIVAKHISTALRRHADEAEGPKVGWPQFLTDYWKNSKSKEKTEAGTAFNPERLKTMAISESNAQRTVADAVARGVPEEWIIDASKYTDPDLALHAIAKHPGKEVLDKLQESLSAPAKESHPATTGPTTAENVSREEIGTRPGAVKLNPEQEQAKAWMEQHEALLKSGQWLTGLKLSEQSRADLGAKVLEYKDFIAGKTKELPESLDERQMIKADTGAKKAKPVVEKQPEPVKAAERVKAGDVQEWLKVPQPEVAEAKQAAQYAEKQTRELAEQWNVKAEARKKLENQIFTGRGYSRRIKASTKKAEREAYATLGKEMADLEIQKQAIYSASAKDRAAADQAQHASRVNNTELPLIHRIGARINMFAEQGIKVPEALNDIMKRLAREEILERFPDATPTEIEKIGPAVEGAARMGADINREFQLNSAVNPQGGRRAALEAALNGNPQHLFSEELKNDLARYSAKNRPFGHNEPVEDLSTKTLNDLKARISSETDSIRAKLKAEEERRRAQEVEEQIKENKLIAEAQAVADSAPKTGTAGGRSAKEVRAELVSRIKDAIDETIDKAKVQLNQREDGEYIAAAQEGSSAAAIGNIEPSGAGGFRVTAHRLGSEKNAINVTVPTQAEAEWVIRAMAAEGTGRAIIAVPGDGVYRLNRSGDRLLQVWSDARKIDVHSGVKGNPYQGKTQAIKPPHQIKTAADWRNAVEFFELQPEDTIAGRSNAMQDFAEKLNIGDPEKITVKQVNDWIEKKGTKAAPERPEPEPEAPAEPGPGMIGMGGATPGESSMPTIEDAITGRLAPERETAQPLAEATTGATLSSWHDVLKNWGESFKGFLGGVAGKTFPRTTLVSKRLGELAARWISSRGAARPVAEVFAADVLSNSGIDPVRFGAALTEDNLRSIKSAFEEKAEEAANRDEIIDDIRNELPDLVERAADGDPEARKELSKARSEIARLKKLTDEDVVKFEAKAKAVNSFIGEKNFPFADEASYQAFLDDPKTKDATGRHIDLWKSVVEPQYKEAMSYDPEMELPSRGLQTGARINLRAVREGEAGKNVVRSASSGGLLNTLRRKSPFGVQAKGTGEAYHMDYYDLMENTFGKQLEIANKNAFERAMVEARQAVIDEPGKTVMIEGKPAVSFPLKRQRMLIPGGSGISQNKAIYINAKLAREYRTGADVDARPPQGVVAGVNKVLNTLAISGLTDATVHVTNLFSALASLPATSGRLLHDALLSAVPGRPDVLIAVGRAVAKGFGDNRAQLASLAEIGARREGAYQVEKGKPSTYRHAGADVIRWVDETTRLALDDAYKRLAQDGLVDNSETARREFINQVGQYNRRAQSFYKRLFRDSGFGPFVTAGTTFNTLGVRGITLNPGVKASSGPAALALRANMLAKLVGTAGTVAVLNYLLTKDKKGGGVMGRPGIPLGAIDLGTDDKNGRPQYFNILGMIGPARGLRVTGARGFLEAKMRGLPTAVALDAASRDIINSAVAPWAGPPVRFTSLATLGYSPAKGVGRQFPVVPPGENQFVSDVKNAALEASPIVAGIHKAQQPGSTGASEIVKSQLPRFTLQPGKPPEMMADYAGIVRRAQANTYIEDVIGRARKMDPETRRQFLIDAVNKLEDGRDREKAIKEFKFRKVL